MLVNIFSSIIAAGAILVSLPGVNADGDRDFSKTCGAWRLGENHIGVALCKSTSKGIMQTALDLNQCFGNKDGQIVSMELRINGEWIDSDIDLNAYIGNFNARFCCGTYCSKWAYKRDVEDVGEALEIKHTTFVTRVTAARADPSSAAAAAAA